MCKHDDFKILLVLSTQGRESRAKPSFRGVRGPACRRPEGPGFRGCTPHVNLHQDLRREHLSDLLKNPQKKHKYSSKGKMFLGVLKQVVVFWVSMAVPRHGAAEALLAVWTWAQKVSVPQKPRAQPSTRPI